MSLDGTTFETLYSFSGGSTDGASPIDGLSSVDSTMYGITSNGGIDDLGTIYSFMVPEPSSMLLVAFSATALFLALPGRRSWTKQRKDCAD